MRSQVRILSSRPFLLEEAAAGLLFVFHKEERLHTFCVSRSFLWNGSRPRHRSLCKVMRQRYSSDLLSPIMPYFRFCNKVGKHLLGDARLIFFLSCGRNLSNFYLKRRLLCDISLAPYLFHRQYRFTSFRIACKKLDLRQTFGRDLKRQFFLQTLSGLF